MSDHIHVQSGRIGKSEALRVIGEVLDRMYASPDGLNLREMDAILAAMGSTHPLTDDELFAEIDRRMAEPDWHMHNARESMIQFGRWVRAFVPKKVGSDG